MNYIDNFPLFLTNLLLKWKTLVNTQQLKICTQIKSAIINN
jgi:hypothetical protein